MTKTLSEHEKARQWREKAGVSQRELSAAIGFSQPQIAAYERGTQSSGLPIGEREWQRYRLACAAYDHGLASPW